MIFGFFCALQFVENRVFIVVKFARCFSSLNDSYRESRSLTE